MNPSPADPIETVAPTETNAEAAGPEAQGERTGVVPAALTPESGRKEASLRVVATRFDLIIVGLAALLASVVGRAVAPALPGSSAGIGPLISSVEQLAGFATQFMAVLGVSTCVRLLLSTLESPSRGFRALALISTTAALPIVISASSRHLSTAWLIALVSLSALLGVAAARPALRAPQSRAAGLILLTVTLGSLVSAFGRVLALYASREVEAELFGLARSIATVALLLDVFSVLLAAVWVARRWRFGVGLVAGLASLAALVVWVGAHSTNPVDGEGWGRFTARALLALTANPDPFVESGLRYFVETYALLVASVALCLRRPPGVGEALCFALLARVSGDVPACALMLMLASLCAVRASLEPVRLRPATATGVGRRASLEVVPATR